MSKPGWLVWPEAEGTEMSTRGEIVRYRANMKAVFGPVCGGRLPGPGKRLEKTVRRRSGVTLKSIRRCVLTTPV